MTPRERAAARKAEVEELRDIIGMSLCMLMLGALMALMWVMA